MLMSTELWGRIFAENSVPKNGCYSIATDARSRVHEARQLHPEVLDGDLLH